MEIDTRTELGSLLKILPPVEFCCVYGSSLHKNYNDKTSMIDYILGVSDPQQWHSENLKINRDHYASWMAHLGGAKLITKVADGIGIGVHFNPFVSWNGKLYKYGVVRLGDIASDIMNWERFYFSGRLQKPVRMIVDKPGIENMNSLNLRAATSAALLLLPSRFTEKDLYAKICSLSYMGDLRMLFAEDKNKVNKIVQSQFDLFKTMYNPLLQEYATKDLLRFSSSGDQQVNISQDSSLSVASSLVSFLPATIRTQMGLSLGEKKIRNQTGQIISQVVIGSKEGAGECIQNMNFLDSSLSVASSLVSFLPATIRTQMGLSLGEKKIRNQTGQIISQVVIGSKEGAGECMRKILRRRVMVSSGRQAVAGLLTVGGISGARYLASKMGKAWKSWA